MKELQLGYISDEDMADWCSKTLASYKKNRRRWSETKLTLYADFNLVHGGVVINKIYDPIYSPSGKKEVRTKYRQCWGNNGNSIDSNKDCWEKLKKILTNELSDTTGRNYVSQAKCEEYGIPYKRNKRDGTKGHCHYVFCKIVEGKPMAFTEEELKIKKELENKYLKDSTQQTYSMKALLADYKRGDITQEEYHEAINDLIELDRDWMTFQIAFEEAIGYPVDFRVELVDNIIKQTALEMPFVF